MRVLPDKYDEGGIQLHTDFTCTLYTTYVKTYGRSPDFPPIIIIFRRFRNIMIFVFTGLDLIMPRAARLFQISNFPDRSTDHKNGYTSRVYIYRYIFIYTYILTVVSSLFYLIFFWSMISIIVWSCKQRLFSVVFGWIT
jgi:hypothetical protein